MAPKKITFAAFKSHHFDQTRRRKAGFVPPLAIPDPPELDAWFAS
jgi:hypothetical protein